MYDVCMCVCVMYVCVYVYDVCTCALYLQKFLLLNSTVLVDVHLCDEVPKLIVRDLLTHLTQCLAQVVDADVAVLVLVKAVEDLRILLGFLIAEGDGDVPHLPTDLVAHCLEVPVCSLGLLLWWVGRTGCLDV